LAILVHWPNYVTAQSTKANDTQPPQTEPNSLRFLRLNLKAFVKNSRREDSPEIQRAAITNLCQLHCWVALDPRYHSSKILKSIRSTAANRLSSLAKQLAATEHRSSVTLNRAASKNLISTQQTAKALLTSASDSEDDSRMFGYGLTNNLHGSFVGGAGQLANYVGGQFGGSASNNAHELIALIEATLDPDYWRTNGGAGSIHYYRPGLALVVTASQEMQDRVHALLMQLK
jgi:hypothetical protein